MLTTCEHQITPLYTLVLGSCRIIVGLPMFYDMSSDLRYFSRNKKTCKVVISN